MLQSGKITIYIIIHLIEVGTAGYILLKLEARLGKYRNLIEDQN